MKTQKNSLTHFLLGPELLFKEDDLAIVPFTISNEGVIDSTNFNFPIDQLTGKQAEACFEYYLKSVNRYQLLASNIQIQGSKETLGELDYIVYDKQMDKILHVELACKFYLYDSRAELEEIKCWIGPNQKDTLLEKILKLKRRQFPLLYASETIEKLRSLDIKAAIEQQLCFKSFLFIPKTSSKDQFSKNYQDCIVGYWIPFSEIDSEEQNAQYMVPSKKEWLFPAEDCDDWICFSEAKEKIQNQLSIKRSPMVLKKMGSVFERYFVVWW